MRRQSITRRQFIASTAALAAAAGAANAADAPQSRLATFTCDVTLPMGTPIYSSYKPLAVVEHPLLAKGIILEDSGGRYVICAVDWCELCGSTYDDFQTKIADAAQVPRAHVAVHTVHQHTAPIANADSSRLIAKTETPPPYTPAEVYEEAATRVATAVKDALARFQPFNQVGIGQAKVERVASNRRILIDGKMVMRASSCTDPRLVDAPEGLIDPYVKTVTFAFDGKPLVRLHHYATHPQSFYGDPRASYDFVGMAREKLQEKEGAFQIYFNGCGGNVAAGKYNNRTPEARQGLCDRLYAALETAAANTTYKPAAPIAWRTLPVQMTARTDKDHTPAELEAIRKDTAQSPDARITAADELIWQQRAVNPVMLAATNIGNAWILHLPGESAVEFQLFAQQVIPEAFIAVAAYADCSMAYICPANFFAEGSYEPSASYVIPETEDTLKAAIQELLKS